MTEVQGTRRVDRGPLSAQVGDRVRPQTGHWSGLVGWEGEVGEDLLPRKSCTRSPVTGRPRPSTDCPGLPHPFSDLEVGSPPPVGPSRRCAVGIPTPGCLPGTPNPLIPPGSRTPPLSRVQLLATRPVPTQRGCERGRGPSRGSDSGDPGVSTGPEEPKGRSRRGVGRDGTGSVVRERTLEGLEGDPRCAPSLRGRGPRRGPQRASLLTRFVGVVGGPSCPTPGLGGDSQTTPPVILNSHIGTENAHTCVHVCA